MKIQKELIALSPVCDVAADVVEGPLALVLLFDIRIGLMYDIARRRLRKHSILGAYLGSWTMRVGD